MICLRSTKIVTTVIIKNRQSDRIAHSTFSYLWIGLGDVRAAGAVGGAGAGQRRPGDVEDLPGRAQVPLGLTPHVEVGRERLHGRDPGGG